MDAFVKALAYVGVILLLGASLFPRFVAPELDVRKRALLFGLFIGAVLVILGSGLNIVLTLTNVLGFFDWSFLGEYVLATDHGWATLIRLGLVMVIVGVSAWGKYASSVSNALILLSGLGLLATFSWISHGAAMGGVSPALADLIHFAAASLWSGAVLYIAFVPAWVSSNQSKLVKAMNRVSTIGLGSVIVLFATGIYSSLLHIHTPEAVVQTSYGHSLLIKVGLVLVILGIAAANRWYFLPALRSGRELTSFGHIIRVEAVLLLLVLGATGLLTTRPVPH